VPISRHSEVAKRLLVMAAEGPTLAPAHGTLNCLNSQLRSAKQIDLRIISMAARVGFALDRVFKNRPVFPSLLKTHAAHSAKNSATAT